MASTLCASPSPTAPKGGKLTSTPPSSVSLSDEPESSVPSEAIAATIKNGFDMIVARIDLLETKIVDVTRLLVAQDYQREKREAARDARLDAFLKRREERDSQSDGESQPEPAPSAPQEPSPPSIINRINEPDLSISQGSSRPSKRTHALPRRKFVVGTDRPVRSERIPQSRSELQAQLARSRELIEAINKRWEKKNHEATPRCQNLPDPEPSTSTSQDQASSLPSSSVDASPSPISTPPPSCSSDASRLLGSSFFSSDIDQIEVSRHGT